MDVAQLLAMWELLAELEGIGARLACERMTPAEREELAAIHERAGAVARREDAEAWQDHNRRFHDALYQGARNPYLRQEILRMRSRTGAYRRHAYSAFGHLASSWAQHGELVAAIQAQDAARAATLMTRHMSPGQGSISFASFIAALPKRSAGLKPEGRGTDRRRIRPAAGPTAGKSRLLHFAMLQNIFIRNLKS